MDTATKIWLILGAILVISGMLLFTVVMTLNHWDFTKLGTVKYVTNTYPITEAFTDLSLRVDTGDIVFVPSDAGSCEVVCYEAENVRHSVSVEDGCLTLRVKDERKWYEHIGINVGSPKITVTLPRGAYQTLVVEGSTGNVTLPREFEFEQMELSISTGNVNTLASVSQAAKIRTSTGDIHVEGIAAGALDLSVTTGKVTVSKVACTGDVSVRVSTGKASLTEVQCQNLSSTGSTGSLILTRVTATEGFSIERSTGDVRFDQCDAGEINVRTETGDVTGSLLSHKTFITETHTGRVSVPKTTGGRCEITTSTGNIKLTIED